MAYPLHLPSASKLRHFAKRRYVVPFKEDIKGSSAEFRPYEGLPGRQQHIIWRHMRKLTENFKH